MYKLKDCSGERLEGGFFTQELSKVTNIKNSDFKIDKFIDEKKIKGVPHVLIKFDGYDKKCSIWMKKSDAIKLNK